MADFKQIPDLIQWYEGMLLSPHHFQQATARQEGLVHYHAHITSPYHWGVRRLTIDKVLLGNGTFRVVDLEAIMPDGLVVSHAAEREGQSLELDLTEYAALMGQEPATIHLAVPVRTSGATRADVPRYETVPGQLVADENTGEGDMSIPRQRPRLTLLFTERESKKPPAQYVTFPLGKVGFQNEKFVATPFVPPQLTVPVDSELGQMCGAMGKALREKAIKLAERALSPSLTLGSPLLLETRTQVASLVAALPHFEATLDTGTAHPRQLYLALCSVIGQVANISAELVPPPLQPYNHNDLRHTFEVALEHLDRMLREGIQDAYSAYSFIEEEPGDFRLGFIWTWMTRRLVLAVRGHQGMSESDVVGWVENCLIGTKNTVRSLRDKRILGAPRTRIDRDEELVPTRGVVLFSLKADPTFIEAGEVLQIIAGREKPDQATPAEIVLYVKNE